MKKYCKFCDTSKDIEEFHKNPRKKDGLADRCKLCRKEYHKEHYNRNKKVYIDKASEYRRVVNKWFEDYKKDLKCEICGEERWWVLDFHHKDPQFKEGNVSTFLQNCSKSKIIEEIKKCSVLCSNCHRDLHYKERQAV